MQGISMMVFLDIVPAEKSNVNSVAGFLRSMFNAMRANGCLTTERPGLHPEMMNSF